MSFTRLRPVCCIIGDFDFAGVEIQVVPGQSLDFVSPHPQKKTRVMEAHSGFEPSSSANCNSFFACFGDITFGDRADAWLGFSRSAKGFSLRSPS